jgi:spore maturation protein SpmA
MNVATRLELQSLLDKIRAAQGSPDSSPLANQAAWTTLILTPLIGVVVSLGVRQPYSAVFFIVLLALFVGSLQSIIKYKFYRLLRPILEALLYVPEEPAKLVEQIAKKSVKATKARPSRGGKK